MAACFREQFVQTTAGPVVGFVDGDVIRWKSIPYARPPVGPLRLRAPQPPVPWRARRYCDKFGFAAPQRPVYAMIGLGKFQATDEDCLTVNVVSPSAASEKPLPVMFFIHGGGWMVGTSAPYGGAALAAHECVVVSVNYRLGALGCLDLSSLSTAEQPIDSNLYLRDIVLALRWVRDNISGFGGDPDKVTIFGESAGAHSVATLMAVPQARGLFSGAIIQSTVLMPIAEDTADVAERFVALLGAHTQDGARRSDACRP